MTMHGARSHEIEVHVFVPGVKDSVILPMLTILSVLNCSIISSCSLAFTCMQGDNARKAIRHSTTAQHGQSQSVQ